MDIYIPGCQWQLQPEGARAASKWKIENGKFSIYNFVCAPISVSHWRVSRGNAECGKRNLMESHQSNAGAACLMSEVGCRRI